MLGKIRKIIDNQKGFTLVELMTVLIILGVILGIGVPKYLKIQAKSEWDADVVTIENIAKAAEVYAAQKNITGSITIADLTGKNIIDGNIALNRTPTGKNTAGTKISIYGTKAFTINSESGQVTNLTTIINELIGEDPYK